MAIPRVVVGKNPNASIPRQPGNNAAANVNGYYNGLPGAWNPALPPPVIMPAKGIPMSPQAYQYPGGIYGAEWEDVQDLIRKQKKTQGQLCVTVASTRNRFPVALSGTAKIFLGIALSNTAAFLATINTRVSLFINNEQIITDVIPAMLMLDVNFNPWPGDFYSYPRPLSGSDDIVLLIDEPAGSALTYQATYYYL